jgi:hypothetical protein
MVLDLLDTDPDPLVRGMDPGPSIIMQNTMKNLDSYWFVTSLWQKNYVNVPSIVISRKLREKK